MYDQSIPFTAYAFISITSLVVTYSYITSNQEEDNEINNNEIDKKETEINSINPIPGIEPSPDLGENVPNFGGKKTKQRTRNKKYKNTKSKRRNSTNKRK
jgi:hypothetical protein